MKDLKFKFSVDGKEISYEDVLKHESERAYEACRVLSRKGAQLYYDGNHITLEEMEKLDILESIRACHQTKHALGMPKILELMTDEAKAGEEAWMQYVDKSEDKKNLHPVIAEIEVTGMSKWRMLKALMKLQKQPLEVLPFAIHPEHYVFSKKGTTQFVMETMCEYKPIYTNLWLTAKSPWEIC